MVFSFIARSTLSAILWSAANVSAAACVSASGVYSVDNNHTQVLFTWNHMGFSFPTGQFGKISGTLTWEDSDVPKSSIKIYIDSESISTNVSKLDEQLKGSEFFAVSNFRDITFNSSEIRLINTGHAQVLGALTLKGVSRPLSLDVHINRVGRNPFNNKPQIGISATGSLLRSEFGMDREVPQVSDVVTLRITSELVLRDPERPPLSKQMLGHLDSNPRDMVTGCSVPGLDSYYGSAAHPAVE